jgi:cardiolipin synthase
MWVSEKVCLDTQAYFESAFEAIRNARQSVVLEMYIFRRDSLGNRMLELLREAAGRGVDVRVLVDSVGSPGFGRDFIETLSRQKISARVFHPTPRVLDMINGPSIQRIRRLFVNINKRNHRKLIVVDKTIAFVGSCNLADMHRHWRETAVQVRGRGVLDLCQSFELIWARSGYSGKLGARQLQARLRARRALGLRRANGSGSAAVRTNVTRALRVTHNSQLVSAIEKARQRVWITTAYFVPSPVIVSALLKATRNGCDVKLLLPGKSDINVVSYVSRMFYRRLMRAGVQIYEYQPAVLHAKTLLIDNWMSVGTTNLNHRSFYHDLEVDVVLQQPQSLALLAGQFADDLSKSQRVTDDNLHRRSWIEKLGGRLVYPFRRFI